MHCQLINVTFLLLLSISCFAKDTVFFTPEAFNTYMNTNHLKIQNIKIKQNTMMISKEVMLANFHNYNSQLSFDKEHNCMINRFNSILEELAKSNPNLEYIPKENKSTQVNNKNKPTYLQFQKYIENGGIIFQFIIKTKNKTEKRSKKIKCPNCHGTGTYQKYTMQKDETVTAQCKRCHGEGSIQETSTSKKQLPPELEIKRIIVTTNK
ncbi:MAG: hypothetical protein J6X49_20075 [Victivallales bacterium]|nr:hypothetical protein [Victivallales bacterium]